MEAAVWDFAIVVEMKLRTNKVIRFLNYCDDVFMNSAKITHRDFFSMGDFKLIILNKTFNDIDFFGF